MSETVTDTPDSALPIILQDDGIEFKVSGKVYKIRRLKNKDAIRLLKIIEMILMKGGEEFLYHFPGRDPLDPANGGAIAPVLLAGIAASESVLMSFLADTLGMELLEFEELPLAIFPALINAYLEHPDLNDFFKLLRQKGGALDRLQMWIQAKTEEVKRKQAVAKTLLKPL